MSPPHAPTDQDRPARPSRQSATRRTVLAATATAGLAPTLAATSAGQQGESGSTAGSTSGGKRVVSYYTGWSRYERDFLPADVPLEEITDLNYAFLTVEQDGTVTYADSWGDQENLAAFRDLKADSPDTRFYLSIGGWSDSTYFSDAAATQANRERFASTAIEIVREYDFDGLDVDWEYPGGGGAEGNVTRPEDPENFVLLLEEVRSQLDAAEQADGREYGLTIAASANSSTAGNLLIGEIEPLLDYVTVMTYDFAGSWSDATGHNAPLYAAGDAPSVASSMQWWAEQPIPRTKLCVGLPFYGREFAGVEGASGDGAGGAALGQPFSSTATVRFANVDAEHPTSSDGGSYARYWDDAAKVPYRYSSADSTFVTYDDAESIAAKTQFAAGEGFGGVMLWEQAGDPDGTLLDVVGQHLSSGSGDGGGSDGSDGGDDQQPTCGGQSVNATATVEPGAGNATTVCDVDDDGLYRDVSGDGNVTHVDVVEFFRVQHREAWKRPELFDFSGNDEVGHGDVIALFEHVATHGL